VTPPDSNGRPFYPILAEQPTDSFPTELISPVRDSVLYMVQNTPLSDPAEPSGTYDLYEAVRSDEGWRTVRRISPSGDEAVFPNAGGVSLDHRYGFTGVTGNDIGGSLAEAGTADYLGNPDGTFELVGAGSLGFEPLAQSRYLSPDGVHVIFSTGGSSVSPGESWCLLAQAKCQVRRLEPNAPPTGTPAVYDRQPDGPTRVVSLLPGGGTPAPGEGAEYVGASADGTVVAFRIGTTLYVRVDNAVTEEVVSGGFAFAGVTEHGERIFYVSGGDIYAFDIAAETTRQAAASGDSEVVNVSADGSHVYFLSASLLDGGKGTGGEPNLYDWDLAAETVKYIATVAQADLEGQPALNRWTSWAVSNSRDVPRGPGADSSRTTPDGRVLVFESEAQLTSYPSASVNEVYRYEASTGDLDCVSCNPLGAPTTGAHLEDYQVLKAAMVIHNVSDDGARVFFETSEAMVEPDTDGVNDIYQWHQEGGTGEPLSLISSGKSVTYPGYEEKQKANVIFGITPDGKDVVFLAQEALVPGAGVGGASALYDARVNGGFPAPPPPPACLGPCPSDAGETRSPSMPLSNQIVGSGNVKPRHKHRCHRAKRRAANAKRHKRCRAGKHHHRRTAR
jgi:hypothetical protein